MEQFNFQDQIVENVISSMKQTSKPVVLALTTSSGKSATVTKLLNKILTPGDKAVYLGSNLTVLAEQYFNSLEIAHPIDPEFTFSKITEDRGTQLTVGLPQQLIARPQKLSLLILDEAQWLFPQLENNPNSMIAKILRNCRPDNIILLSGSPTYFTKRAKKFNIHYLSYDEIQNKPCRVFSKIDIDIISVMNRNNIYECLELFFKSSENNKDDLSKFIVVARNIREAEYIKTILETTYRVKTTISTSRHDKNSENLKTFTDKRVNYQCCVTCNRIVAGWSYDALSCILDLRASQDLCNSFQLISRLFRVNQKNPNRRKTYYRVSLKKNYNKSVLFLHKVMALTKKEIFKGAIDNGNNIKLVVS